MTKKPVIHIPIYEDENPMIEDEFDREEAIDILQQYVERLIQAGLP